MVFGHGRGDRSRSRATPSQSGRIPTHEPERRRRLSLPAARAAPPASSRPFPQPGPSPRSPSSSAALLCLFVVPVFVLKSGRSVPSYCVTRYCSGLSTDTGSGSFLYVVIFRTPLQAINTTSFADDIARLLVLT